MAQDIHVTSNAIRQLGKDLVEDVAPAFDPVARQVAEAVIESPGFGLVGFPLQHAYEQAQAYLADYVKAGRDQLGTFRGKLDGIATTWEQAESTNQVMYR
ncbi:hypothetical protein GCM10009827_064240 [Dactylosporangium maewongense]|uniref:Excreted virulence factor EspC (Type VII ESX diderm) n=1 Tax=Dactylosporangium maewongense TaxID=634393 RepID=A0ABP4M3E5_9ACTN